MQREGKVRNEEASMEEETMEGFLKWAGELGISDSPNTLQFQQATSCLGCSLSVSHFPNAGGRGLSAARDLRKGEMVLRVPKSALLTTDTLLKDNHILSLAINAQSYLSPTQVLTVCLLYEVNKGKRSQWYPYLMHLPQSYHTLSTFSEFEKQAFQVDDATWSTEKAISKAEAEWKMASPLLKQLKFRPQLLTFRAWIWASATISSRTMHISWDKAGCLCPVGDLFNYAAPGEESNDLENIEYCNPRSLSQDSPLMDNDFTDNSQRLTDAGFNEDIDAYCFYARKNYRKGEQVLLSYGTYTNLELLEHYGFLLDDNPNDKVFVPLGPDMYSSNSWPMESMYIHQDGKPSFVLLSALRLWATPPDQRRSIGHLVYSGSQLSTENEITIMKWILKHCQILLNNLPTKMEEDSWLLSTIDNFPDLQNPVELEKVSCMLASGECAFLEANSLQKEKDSAELTVPSKKASTDRWRLAVQWRFRYKKILIDCISYCIEAINSLSSQNVLVTRTKNMYR